MYKKEKKKEGEEMIESGARIGEKGRRSQEEGNKKQIFSLSLLCCG